jgi:arylsulfatase A-like enzyme
VLAQLDSEPWIIVVGDNGTPALLEDKAKTTTFERGIRVPMVVSHQSLGVPRETLELVHVADIMATVAELAGTPLPNDPEVISESFLPQVYGRDPGRRSHVVCWTEDFDDRCVRMPRWKLRQVMGSEELYDLLRDPDEEDPIDPQHPRYRRFADALRELFPSW